MEKCLRGRRGEGFLEEDFLGNAFGEEEVRIFWTNAFGEEEVRVFCVDSFYIIK
jgi:hypothetical protein